MQAISSALNAGQGAILAVGLTGVLALAASTAGVGTFTAGDLVISKSLSLPYSFLHHSSLHKQKKVCILPEMLVDLKVGDVVATAVSRLTLFTKTGRGGLLLCICRL